jgi:hypothetical protein
LTCRPWITSAAVSRPKYLARPLPANFCNELHRPSICAVQKRQEKYLRSVPGKPRTNVADHHHHACFSSFFRVKRRSIAPIERANPKRIDRADPDTYAARAPLKAELKPRRRVARVTSVPDEHILLLPSTGASN